jgi:hypothetical protein
MDFKHQVTLLEKTDRRVLMPILFRCHAHMAFEESGKMRGCREIEPVGYAR